MSYFGNDNEGEKILRGAYSYTRNNNIYSEENFEIFRDKKEMTFTFQSEMVSRVSTGELLNINVNYKINKDYIPVRVEIARNLGGQSVSELYTYDQRRTKINYTFTCNDEEITEEISPGPKFFITTPAACSSMIFLRSKKFDATSKNYYNIYISKNGWEFVEEPSVKNIVVQRVSTTSETLKIDGANLQAIQYKLAEQTNGPEAAEAKSGSAQSNDVRIWLSQHMTVPYLIKSQDGTKIQIKFLNNLDKDQ